MYKSRVTTSVHLYFTIQTFAGIVHGVQINTLCCNGQTRSRLHITQISPVSWIRNSATAAYISISPPGDSLHTSHVAYWFIIIAVDSIISPVCKKSIC